ncbi:MAG TPA: hypothetical protein VGG39_02480 [Polyangiaceae bacterium]|jgi:hypothetical protein
MRTRVSLRMRWLVLGAACAAMACGRGSGAAATPGADAGAGDVASPADAGGPAPCVTNPQTYLEIINACTDAQAVDKDVNLAPMSAADGGLRPLP